MGSLAEIVYRQQQASLDYFDDPDKDRMMPIIVSLTEELRVLRDRLDERALESARALETSR